MNIRDWIRDFRLLKRKPLVFLTGFLFLSFFIIYSSSLTKVPDIIGGWLNSSVWKSHKTTIGSTWNIEVLERQFDGFSFSVIDINENGAEIEISSPTIGRYTLHCLIIEKGYSHAFTSGDFFYSFHVTNINLEEGYVESNIRREKQRS
jgi:hypothetical protein